MAWRIPPVWNDLLSRDLIVPQNSSVPQEQKQLVLATKKVLEATARDVQLGLLETVGIKSTLLIEECCSIVLELPEKTDTEFVARAIDAENIEAWCDLQGRVRIGISPWLSTKDVDQTVLCTIKVVHVLLGVHAANTAEPKTFVQKTLAAVSEIMMIQKGLEKNKN